MKKSAVCSALMLAMLLASVVIAMELADDIAKYGSCSYCGMDRQKFAHSRMLIEYSDGSSIGVCSLHCAALDLANQLNKMPTNIKVADFNSKALVGAEEATWVVGGGVKGVMTGRAKWAFVIKTDAEKFISTNGGEIVGFEEAAQAAYEDMYKDTKMIRMKRQEMKKMKMKM